MRGLRGFILGFSLAVVAPVLAVSTLGNLEVDWPDFLDPGGAAQVTTIHNAVTKLSDNMASRISENSAVADSTTTVITHNFGVAFVNLQVSLFSGVGSSKTPIDANLVGYTIAANGGDPTNKIDVTTPGAGGPHDFTVVVEMIPGAPKNSFVLGETISGGTVVGMGSGGKLEPALKLDDAAVGNYLPAGGISFDNNVNGRVSVAYDPYNDVYGVLSHHSGGFLNSHLVARDPSSTSWATPAPTTTLNVATSTTSPESCLMFDEEHKKFVAFWMNGSTMYYRMGVGAHTARNITWDVTTTASSVSGVSKIYDCVYNVYEKKFYLAVQHSAAPRIYIGTFVGDQAYIETNFPRDLSFLVPVGELIAAYPAGVVYAYGSSDPACFVEYFRWDGNGYSPGGSSSSILVGAFGDCDKMHGAYDERADAFLLTYTEVSTGDVYALKATLSAHTISGGSASLVKAGGSVSKVDAVYRNSQNADFIIAIDDGTPMDFYRCDNSGASPSCSLASTVAGDPAGTNTFLWDSAPNGRWNMPVFCMADANASSKVSCTEFGPLLDTNISQSLGILPTGGVLDDIREVKLWGDIVDGFVGKTPGDKAYIAPDGAIQDSPFWFVDKAYPMGSYTSATDLFFQPMPREDRR